MSPDLVFWQPGAGSSIQSSSSSRVHSVFGGSPTHRLRRRNASARFNNRFLASPSSLALRPSPNSVHHLLSLSERKDATGNVIRQDFPIFFFGFLKFLEV
jgi:hypothetical protein